jgi:hypothetical protein
MARLTTPILRRAAGNVVHGDRCRLQENPGLRLVINRCSWDRRAAE